MSFPHVQAVRVLRTETADPGAIPMVMVLEMDFASIADIRDCLASDIKTKVHAPTLDVLKPFTGRVFHFVAGGRSAIRLIVRLCAGRKRQPRRSLIRPATRRTLTMMVSVGFTAPIDGKKLASVT